MEQHDPNDQGVTMKHPRASESGFSLLELLVAMVITLIVSGAIFGLMSAGQNAFRREPELAERQQSIRLAMDLITRDIANAGSGLPPLSQVFTTGLAGLGPVGPSGTASDDLEMLSVAGRDSEPVCEAAGNGAPTNVSLYRQGVTLPENTLVFLVFSRLTPSSTTAPQTQDDHWVARRVTSVDEQADPQGGAPAWELCRPSPAGMHSVLYFGANAFNPGTLCANANLSPRGNFPGVNCGTARITRAVFGQQVRYQVRNAPDGVPVLERISTEDTTLTPQVIARGIEEMQVRYSQFDDAGGPWQETAPTVDPPTEASLNLPSTRASFGTIVNRLQITLTSRAEGRDLQGAVSNAAGTAPARIRGSLVTTVSPRAALLGVARGRPENPPSPAPPIVWYWE
ncbi:MAG: prepilin-type N-terminal cleavage/methylation domain-containing protein [Vicinamibacteria bacterium]